MEGTHTLSPSNSVIEKGAKEIAVKIVNFKGERVFHEDRNFFNNEEPTKHVSSLDVQELFSKDESDEGYKELTQITEEQSEEVEVSYVGETEDILTRTDSNKKRILNRRKQRKSRLRESKPKIDELTVKQRRKGMLEIEEELIENNGNLLCNMVSTDAKEDTIEYKEKIHNLETEKGTGSLILKNETKEPQKRISDITKRYQFLMANNYVSNSLFGCFKKKKSLSSQKKERSLQQIVINNKDKGQFHKNNKKFVRNILRRESSKQREVSLISKRTQKEQSKEIKKGLRLRSNDVNKKEKQKKNIRQPMTDRSKGKKLGLRRISLGKTVSPAINSKRYFSVKNADRSFSRQYNRYKQLIKHRQKQIGSNNPVSKKYIGKSFFNSFIKKFYQDNTNNKSAEHTQREEGKEHTNERNSFIFIQDMSVKRKAHNPKQYLTKKLKPITSSKHEKSFKSNIVTRNKIGIKRLSNLEFRLKKNKKLYTDFHNKSRFNR